MYRSSILLCSLGRFLSSRATAPNADLTQDNLSHSKKKQWGGPHGKLSRKPMTLADNECLPQSFQLARRVFQALRTEL